MYGTLMLREDGSSPCLKQGESGIRLTARCDMYASALPGGEPCALFRRADGAVYPLTVSFDGAWATVELSAADTAFAGEASLELQWRVFREDGEPVVAKGKTYLLHILQSAASCAPSQTPLWADRVFDAARAADEAQETCEEVLASIPPEYTELVQKVTAQGARMAEARGYLLDRITEADDNYTIFGSDESGHRWDFTTGAEDAREGKYYYGIYVIPEGTKIVGILGYHYNGNAAAYGFYSGDPRNGGICVYVAQGISSGQMPHAEKTVVPGGATHLVVQLGGGPTQRGVYPYTESPISYIPAATFNVFDNAELDGLLEAARVKHALMAGNRLVAGIAYTTKLKKRLWIKELGNRLDNQSGAETFADIKLMDGTDMGSYKDRGNDPSGSVLQVAHMAYSDGYLYIALRAGGAPASGYRDVANSVLATVRLSDLVTTAWYTSTDRFCTVRVYGDRLLVGERAGGFRLYDLTDPAEPAELMHVTDADVTEFQHGCLFTRGSTSYAAFGCYESGVAVYQLGTSSASRIYLWNGLDDIGQGLNVFSVECSGNYLYGTVAPSNAQRSAGSRTMGVIAFDLTKLAAPVYCGFYPIPEEDCGNWAARVAVSDGALSLINIADPAPDIARASGSWLYVNNEDKGIAVYRLSDPTAPGYAGLIPLTVWPRYFELYGDMIIAGGEYNFLKGEKGAVQFRGAEIG